MRFHVTSISCEACAGQLRQIAVKLQDWLNATVADGEFGAAPDQFLLMLVAVDDDPAENQRWARPHDKLGYYQHPVTAMRTSCLSLAISMSPSSIATQEGLAALSIVSMTVRRKILIRPKRLPTGFEHGRCFSAMSAALGAYVLD
ncbi:MAG: hypothetical protein JWR60_347 [Polaromonas sp.]|nr:hypothetical protein [Polaromonas sp.]